MLLRRHKINAATLCEVEAEKDIQKEIYGKELNYEEEPDKFPCSSFTKTSINRMSTAELQELAEEQGIEDAREINGSELKKILIEKFRL